MSQPITTTPIIPDHLLLRTIGRGSYGEVWLARNVLGTLRAVKIVRRADFSNPRPFERELAGIQHVEPLSRGHEGLVDILQVGRGENDEFFYYVMELADAANDGPARAESPKAYKPRSLGSDLATRGRLPVNECIDLFHGLALALAHLHRAGLVHRDIKPSNIIFVGGVAKLADIGLVAFADGSQSYVGTEGFIPPEGAGTVAADIYSLGKVLYEVGTGKDRSEFPSLPLDASDLNASAGLMELNAVWLKASANNPAERYQNVDELAADLALLRAGRSVKRLRVVETRLRRARQFASIVGAVAAVVALGWFMSKREADRERESRQQADLLRNRAEQAELATRNLLSEARISEAKAVLQSQQIGRSRIVLSLLTNQVDARHRVQARSLVAAALALPDLVPVTKSLMQKESTEPILDAQADGSIVARFADGHSRIIPSQAEPLRKPFIPFTDGRFLYAAYGDSTERIWDLEDGRMVARLDTEYYQLAFRPNHPQVAVAYVNGDMILRHLPGWEADRVWSKKSEGSPMKWGADGADLITVTGRNHLWLLNPESGVAKDLGAAKAAVEAVDLHPDGKHLLVGTGDGYMRVLDVDTGVECALLARHDSRIIYGVFLPPYPWLLTSSWDGTSRLWDWQAGHELGRFEATGYDLNYDAANRLVRWRIGGRPKDETWRASGGEVWREFFHTNPRESGGPFMVSFSRDSQWVAAPDNDGIRVWHVATGTEAHFLAMHSQDVWINADATELIGHINGAIRQFHLSHEPGNRLQAQETKNLGGALGGKLAVNSDASVIAWLDGGIVKLVDHDQARQWQHGQAEAETIAISSDGHTLAVGTRNGRGARGFEVPDGRLLWKTNIGFGTHLSFSQDSQSLAVGTEDGCYIFAAQSGELRWHRGPAAGQEPAFWETAFSPDGAFVAWTPKPSQIQILNASDGSVMMALDYPTRRYITRLVFSPDGRWLAETSTKHMLHLWDLRELHRQLDAFGLAW